MKITDIRVINKYSDRNGPALVEVESDDGTVGIGATASSLPVITAIIEMGTTSLKTLLLGADPRDTAYLWDKMTRNPQHGRHGDGGFNMNAIAAIDMALWDLRGKALNMPIYKLLGGPIQKEIMVYKSTSRWNRWKMKKPIRYHPNGKLAKKSPESSAEDQFKTTDEMVTECKEYVDAGFKAIKYGWGDHFDSEADSQLAAIREAIGPDVRLMLDFGCPAYLSPSADIKYILKACEMLKKHDIFFLEEPLHPHDLKGFIELTANSPIRIATGESLTKVEEFYPFIQKRGLDVAQPDVQQMGISGLRSVVDLCEISNTICVPHCPWTAMAVAGHLNVLSCSNSGNMIEYKGFGSFEIGSNSEKHTSAMNFQVIENPPIIEDGYVQLTDSPGLGLGNYVHEVVDHLFGQKPGAIPSNPNINT